MKAQTGLVIFLILVAGIIGLILANGSDDNSETETSNNETTSQVSEAESEEAAEIEENTDALTFTQADVATHNSASDCWTTIDGNVYDITEYIPRHPGGNTILEACGDDGSSLFNERTTNDGETVGSGTSHSSNASAALQGFQIGTLSQ